MEIAMNVVVVIIDQVCTSNDFGEIIYFFYFGIIMNDVRRTVDKHSSEQARNALKARPIAYDQVAVREQEHPGLLRGDLSECL